jgi:hypothetical protein
MNKLFLVLILMIGFISQSQVVTLIGKESTYTSVLGQMNYKDVLNTDFKFEISESVNVTYEFDLDLKRITYNISGLILTKSFTSLDYNKKTKIVVFTYNDEGTDNSGNIVSVPVTIELDLNSGKERMLMSWFNKEGAGCDGITVVQNTKGIFTIN